MPLSKIYVLDKHSKFRKGFGDLLDDARMKSIPTVSARPAAKDTLAYLVFSSGTTGLPKGLPLYNLIIHLIIGNSGHDITWKYHIFHHANCRRFASN